MMRDCGKAHNSEEQNDDGEVFWQNESLFGRMKTRPTIEEVIRNL
jgi:hypothetical protein